MRYIKQSNKEIYYKIPETCYCNKLNREEYLDTICMYCGLEVSKVAKKYNCREEDVLRANSKMIKRYGLT